MNMMVFLARGTLLNIFFYKLDSPKSATLKARVKFISQRNFRIISFELVEVPGRILWELIFSIKVVNSG